MGAWPRSWWQTIRRPLVVVGIIVACALGVALIVGIIGGYIFNWDWTGLNATDFTSTPQNITKTIAYQPEKTLWDWLNLLAVFAIPIVVGFGAVWYTARQSHDLQITADNQRETALQAYIDKMTVYKTTETMFAETDEGKRTRIAARARTLALLPSLDANRKRILLQFLYELDLISIRDEARHPNNPIIKLNFADLSGANLARLNLKKADLAQSNLSGANLRDAILIKANLQDTILDNADLSKANLCGATGITVEELEKQAKSLKGATMPDGSIHP